MNMKMNDWSLALLGPGEKTLLTLPVSDETGAVSVEAGGMRVTLTLKKLGGVCLFEAAAASDAGADCYFSLIRSNVMNEMLGFIGPVEEREIYRQSPHDPNQYQLRMKKQAIPMGAAKIEGGYEIALSDAPYYSDNYTTQEFIPEEHRFAISSGDSGRKPGYQGGLSFEPYYHHIGGEKKHIFRFLIFSSEAKSLARLRLDTFRAISQCFGDGGNSLYRAICFSTNYMHLRKNETGTSDCWVVAGIEYGNTQYIRDSFWQSMILPDAISAECNKVLTAQRCVNAENPLILLLWAYRVFKAGSAPRMEDVNGALERIRFCTTDGCFHPKMDSFGRVDFRSWFDLCAHTDTDVITYNQGLYAAAMHGAYEMGCATEEEYLLAAERYRGMFIKELGIYPVSREKVALCVDALVGDLLHRLLFGTHILPSEDVVSHYKIVCDRCSTKYGVKVCAALDGSYNDVSFFGIDGYLADYFTDPKYQARPGHYIWGSSYFIYEMLFHIDACLQGAPGAEQNVIDRTLLDLSLGSTYFEHIDTVSGEPNKANQGWNAAIYAIWNQLMQEGAVSGRYFEEVDKYLAAVE